MMSKFLAKVIKKGALLSIILAVLVAAAGVVTLIFGINDMANISNGKKVVVTVDPVLYKDEEEKAEIKALCDEAFDGAIFVQEGDNGNGGEFVYAFKANADLTKIVEDLEKLFEPWTENYSLTVSVNRENVLGKYAEGYVLRAVIAGVVLAVLAFAYVALRYNWRMGLVTVISVAVSVALTSAIVILTRIPTSMSTIYALMTSAIVTVITVLFNLNKLRGALKNEGAEKDTEKLIVSSVAVKETAIFTAILGGAILLVCMPAGAIWFAVSAFVGVAAAAFVGIIYMPAICYPVQNAIAAKAASTTKYGYKGAKKGEKPASQAEPQKAAVKEEPKKEEPAPATEETTAEEPATEEKPVEETAETEVEESEEKADLGEQDAE